MAYVAGHLSVAALEERYEACEDVTSSRHFQTIWLLAKGHSTGEVAGMTSFGQRWIEQLVERYNALGCRALWPAAQSQPPSSRSNNSCCGATPADYWRPIPRSRGHSSNLKHNASQAREPRLSRPCGGEPPCPGVGTGRCPRKADGRTLTLTARRS